MPRFIDTLRQHRYGLLSCALVLLIMSHVRNGDWTSDFWEHSAAVRELATHPRSPHHPQLSSLAPHAFYSPYSLAVAWVSRLTGLDPVSSLGVAAVANLLLFLAALRWFACLVLETTDSTPAFYTLLFMLVLWGVNPWTYSGFLHLNALGYTLPYPSTFATALTLLAWSIGMVYLQRGGALLVAAIVALATLAILCHPISAIVLQLGLVTLLISRRRVLHFDGAVVGAACVGSIVLATAWPYFSFIDLAVSQSAVFHERNSEMYVGVLSRTFPALVGVPVIVSRLRRDRRDWLGLTFAGLLLIYAYGYLSGHWSYGRVIATAVFMLHVVMARTAGELEARVFAPTQTVARRALAGVCAATLFGIFLVNSRSGLGHAIPGRAARYDDYLFLTRYTSQDDVVLSDINTSWMVPTFGGKIVAARHPLAFVPDQAARREDVAHFFDPKTRGAERTTLIDKYHVRFLLLNDERIPNAHRILDTLQTPAKVIYRRGPFTLIELGAHR